MNLMKIEQQITMTTREIAELTCKEHSNIMRDVRNMMVDLSTDSELNSCIKSTTYTGKDGRSYSQYELDKDACLTLLLGYDTVARMKVVKRWQELEAKVAKQLSPAEMFMQSAQTMLMFEQRTAAIEQQQQEVQKDLANQKSKLQQVSSSLEGVKQTNLLTSCPTNAETITSIRTRMNKEYGLSVAVVDSVMRQSPYAPKPCGMVRNTCEEAKGSTYAVYWKKDVSASFKRFADECQKVTPTQYQHCFVEGKFKLNKE